MSPNDLGVGNAVREPEPFQYPLIEPFQRAIRVRRSFENPGREYTAALCDIERWRSVRAGYGVDHLPLEPDGIDVKNVSRHKTLQHKKGLLVAKAVNFLPDILLVVKFVDSYSDCH